MRLAARYPYFLQEYGRELWNAVERSPITMADVDEVGDLVADQLARTFYGPRTSSAYLFVDDAEDVAEAWRSAGVHLHSPEDTEWGRHEGAVVDPDGNVIRFGSAMTGAAER